EPDLFVVSPTTWSAIRRIKNTYGDFILAADPSRDETDSIWGIDVLATTQIADGQGLFITSGKFGRVLVREPLAMRIGYSGTDFTDNVVRTICEERLCLAVERPPACLSLT